MIEVNAVLIQPAEIVLRERLSELVKCQNVAGAKRVKRDDEL